jgi:threonylcarbamoyladenosine tRNA methylthiotransferase MtaB
LRLSSLDPAEADEDLFRLMADEPRLMPHFHISAQAGDDMILKRMKRRHTRADIVAFCDRVRTLRPDAVFGADLIAGFPTEDEAMFENTLALVDDADLSLLHVFPYSIRPGTPAARMPQVNGAAIKERAARLRAKGAQALTRSLARQVGRRVNVLMEKDGRGHSEHYLPVEITAAAPGRIVSAAIVGATPTHLTGVF